LFRGRQIFKFFTTGCSGGFLSQPDTFIQNIFFVQSNHLFQIGCVFAIGYGSFYPILVFAVNVIAAFLQFAEEIGFERGGGQYKDLFFRFHTLGNSNGCAGFAGTKTMINEKTAIGRIQIQIQVD
jgi:hypothetical protein